MVPGHFAERHFAERHFAEGHFAERTFCRTDSLPKGQLAENRDVRYFVRMFATVTHFSTNSQPLCKKAVENGSLAVHNGSLAMHNLASSAGL